MKDKSKVLLIAIIILVAALIAYVCYGIIKGKKNPIVTMQVSYIDSEGNEKNGTVKIELYPEAAPESVANFVALANNGYYDGLTFHRVVKDFVVQGGDKKGDGSGSASYSDLFETYVVEKIENGKATCKRTNKDENKEIEVSKLPENVQVGTMIWYMDGKYQKDIKDYTYSIKGEFATNGINNNIKFGKGIIGMARSDYSSYGLTEQGYNSASSQFFIVTTDDKASLSNLNQNYAAFGKVIEGYEFIEEIEKLYAEKDEKEESSNEEENKEEDKDVARTLNVRVDTFGVKYGLPNTLNYDETMKLVNQYQSLYQQLNQQQYTNEENAQVVE